MTDKAPTSPRLASRVILIAPDSRVLYLRATVPDSGRSFWVMPGGGLEPGESFEEAARREGYEETGCTFTLGPCVWLRRHRYLWDGHPLEQHERFFVAHAEDTRIAPLQQDGYVSGHRWWSLEEIHASADTFAPKEIRNLLPPILAQEYPVTPIPCDA